MLLIFDRWIYGLKSWQAAAFSATLRGLFNDTMGDLDAISDLSAELFDFAAYARKRKNEVEYDKSQPKDS